MTSCSHPCPSWMGHRTAVATPWKEKGCIVWPLPTHQAFPVPGAGQAGKSQHLTGFSQAPKESEILLGLGGCKIPKPSTKSLQTSKAGTPTSGRWSPQFSPKESWHQNSVANPLPPVPVRVWGMVIQGLGNTGDGRARKSDERW